MAAVSAIALTSCVNEDNFGDVKHKQQAQELRFDLPAMMKTRANVKGEITGSEYDKGEDFKVFCKYYKGAYTSWDAAEGDYFTATGDVAVNQGGNSNYWQTDNVYYWPDHEYNLAFAAFSPAVLETAPEKIEQTATGLYIKGFKTETNADAQYDLMYSDRVVDRNIANNGSTAVPLVFRHALSSIVFSTEKEDENVNYEITSIKLHGSVIQQADFNQNIDESVDVKAGSAKWENFAAATDATYIPTLNGAVTVTTVPTQFTQKESALLLIPQDVHNDLFVTVTYNKITNPNDPAKKLVMQNTAKINLNQFAQENGNKITTWEMGKRYVYRISFGLNKRIYFEPSTTDWVQEPTLIYTIQ